jgi:putative aldouronate transport system permease protein
MLGAYPLSNKNFCLRKPINILLIITMFFSGGIIPLFLLVNWMGLYNTRWALILPFITGAWNIIIARIYIGETIGRSLIEAAKIDGYNDIYILFKIVYPMSLPLLAYLGLQAAVAHWNSYFNALIFISEDRLQPIQIFLMRLLIQNSNEVVQQSSTDFAQSYKYIMQIKYAAIIVATLPIIAVYPFLQKYFVKGIMIGALK